MIAEIFLIVTGFFVMGVILWAIFQGVRSLREEAKPSTVWWEFIFIVVYAVALIIFLTEADGAEYYIAVDYDGGSYTALSGAHTLTLIVFLSLFTVSAVAVWLRGRKLPPLALALCIAFLLIGTGISAALVIQLSGGSDSGFDPWRNEKFQYNRGFDIGCSLYPLMNMVLALVLMIRVVRQEATASASRQYKNRSLNSVNQFLARHPVKGGFLLLLPVFVVVTLLLLLFGQQADSIIKVFTETTTWEFSQHTHPAYLEPQGHYLCTVAACGHPKLVKPLRLGKRQGNTIIVNRQLMVANAYEEMLSDYAPALHRFVRRMYDKYGYPLSKHISTAFRSDVVYLLMKPLEYFFLLNLYLFCLHPERKISRQYL